MGFLDKKIYDQNYPYKYFEPRKNEITMAGYIEYLRLKDKIENKPQRRENGDKSK